MLSYKAVKKKVSLTFWLYIPNNKNIINIHRDDMITKRLQKVYPCLVTFIGMNHL